MLYKNLLYSLKYFLYIVYAILFIIQLIDQLAPGGRLVLPVGPRNSDQVLVQVDKTRDGKIKKTTLTGVVFVPLTSKDKQYPS